ncbi:C-Myc-binding protein isoform X1 [Lepidochelys kempii]|uniref:C-Myc-binding protein isoform X1 n=1 Tax=Lepidochelys kempii TaxID=8472 RepID=UPI003C6FB869
MAHYKAADSKREQFRRYLEKSGVLDTLTKVLVALYEEPEKPNSALDFLKHHIGAAAPENPEVEALRLEVAEMKEKYEAVLEENKKLKAKLLIMQAFLHGLWDCPQRSLKPASCYLSTHHILSVVVPQ